MPQQESNQVISDLHRQLDETRRIYYHMLEVNTEFSEIKKIYVEMKKLKRELRLSGDNNNLFYSKRFRMYASE